MLGDACWHLAENAGHPSILQDENYTLLWNFRCGFCQSPCHSEDYQAAMHVDKNNFGPSFIVGLGGLGMPQGHWARDELFPEVQVSKGCKSTKNGLNFCKPLTCTGNYTGGWLWLDNDSSIGRAANVKRLAYCTAGSAVLS